MFLVLPDMFVTPKARINWQNHRLIVLELSILVPWRFNQRAHAWKALQDATILLELHEAHKIKITVPS